MELTPQETARLENALGRPVDARELKRASKYQGIVLTFAASMAKELETNEHKGDWSKWQPDVAQLKQELAHHFAKLFSAIQANEPERVKSHSADIGNIAMKAAEVFGKPHA